MSCVLLHVIDVHGLELCMSCVLLHVIDVDMHYVPTRQLMCDNLLSGEGTF